MGTAVCKPVNTYHSQVILFTQKADVSALDIFDERVFKKVGPRNGIKVAQLVVKIDRLKTGCGNEFYLFCTLKVCGRNGKVNIGEFSPLIFRIIAGDGDSLYKDRFYPVFSEDPNDRRGCGSLGTLLKQSPAISVLGAIGQYFR